MNASDFGGAASPGLWVTGTTYPVGKVVISPVDFCYYVRKVAGAGATDPSADTTNWQNTNGVKSIQRGVISTNSGTTVTATITSVATGKTELRFLGFYGSTADSIVAAHLTLTNSTTITATKANATAITGAVSWELTERF